MMIELGILQMIMAAVFVTCLVIAAAFIFTIWIMGMIKVGELFEWYPEWVQVMMKTQPVWEVDNG